MPLASTKFVTRNGRKFKVPIGQAVPPPRLGIKPRPVTGEAKPFVAPRIAPTQPKPVGTEKEALGPFTGARPPSRLGEPERRISLEEARLEGEKDRAGIARPEPKRVEELGAPEPVEGISTEERIFLKKSRGEALTDEEKLFERSELLKRFDTAADPFEDVGDVLGKRITGLEEEKEAEKERLKTDREKRIEEKEKELGIEFGREETKLRAAGGRRKEAALSALSFSGFARSTKSAEQQGLIQEDVESAVQAADSRRKLQLDLFKRQEEGADAESLEGMRNQISSLKEQEIQFELDSAIKVAELNAENAVMGAEALENLMQSFGAETQRAVDKTASELLGFVADEFGNPMLDAEGNNIPVNKEEGDISWGTFVDPFTGKTIFFNKANPNQTIGAPGSSTTVSERPDGSLGSSETSNISGMQDIGGGNEFTRDNGTRGLLGENCVKYARTKVSQLPFGLNNKQDKINAIKAEGETDMSLVKPGDAILTGEGSWGHAAIVESIDPETGELILEEANYQSGRVTSGRRIDPNDTVIYGFINAGLGPAQRLNEKENEGENAGIDTQVLATQAPEVQFKEGEKAEFRQYLKDGTLPKQLKFPAQQIAFKEKAEVFAAQLDKAFAEGGLSEIMLASKGGSNPDQSFRSSWNKAVNVGSQLGSLVSLINAGKGTTPDTGESVDWAPLTAWFKEKNPWDLNAQQMKANLVSIVPNLARGIFGEVGVLTDNDVKIYMQTIPNLRQTKDVQKAVASATLTLVRNSMANQLRTQAQSGIDVSKFVSNWETINERLDKINAELGIGEGGGQDQEIEEIREMLQNPAPNQIAEINENKADLREGEQLVLRRDASGELKFTAITADELVSSDIQL